MALGQRRAVVVRPLLRRVAAGVDAGQALRARADRGVAEGRAPLPVPPGGGRVVRQGAWPPLRMRSSAAHVEGDSFWATSTGVVGPFEDLLVLMPFPLRLPAALDAADESHGEADDNGACHEDPCTNLGRRDVA